MIAVFVEFVVVYLHFAMSRSSRVIPTSLFVRNVPEEARYICLSFDIMWHPLCRENNMAENPLLGTI